MDNAESAARIRSADVGRRCPERSHELRQALEFARHCGRLERDKTARDLWASVYDELSEGETGLVGALLARSEAQVLRLSDAVRAS